jgi:hypothetical protein
MLVNKNNNDLSKNQPIIDPKIRFSNCSVLSLKIMPKLNLDASKPSNEFSVSLVLAYMGNIDHNKKKKYWIEEEKKTELSDNLSFTPVTFPNTIITISNNNISDLSIFFGISNIVLQKIKQTGKAIRVLCLRHALSQHNPCNQEQLKWYQSGKTRLTTNTNLKAIGQDSAKNAGEAMGTIFKDGNIILSDIGASDLIRTEQTLGFFIQGVKQKYPAAIADFLNGKKQIITIPCAHEVSRKNGDNASISDEITKGLTFGALKQGFWAKENHTNCRDGLDFAKNRSFLAKERKDCSSVVVDGNDRTTIQVNWELYKKYYLQKKNGKAGQREGYRDQQDLAFATSKCINANFMGLFINYVFLSDENFDAFALKVETPVDVKEVVPWVEGDDYNDAIEEGDDNEYDGNWKISSTGGKLRKSRKSRNTKRYQKSKRYRKTKKVKKNRKTRKIRK